MPILPGVRTFDETALVAGPPARTVEVDGTNAVEAQVNAAIDSVQFEPLNRETVHKLNYNIPYPQFRIKADQLHPIAQYVQFSVLSRIAYPDYGTVSMPEIQVTLESVPIPAVIAGDHCGELEIREEMRYAGPARDNGRAWHVRYTTSDMHRAQMFINDQNRIYHQNLVSPSISSTSTTLTNSQLNIHAINSFINFEPNSLSTYTFEFITNGTVAWAPALNKKRLHRNIPFIARKRTALSVADFAEEKARKMLRDMLTEKDYRRYITNGFIMVKGESDYWYQIFNNIDKRVRVYLKGEKIGELCIHTDSKCPKTDHVINMKLLVELDEKEIWFNSNHVDFKKPPAFAKPANQRGFVINPELNGTIAIAG